MAGLASMRDLQVEVSEKDGYIRSLKHELLDSKSRIAAQNLQLNSFSTDLFQVRSLRNAVHNMPSVGRGT